MERVGARIAVLAVIAGLCLPSPALAQERFYDDAVTAFGELDYPQTLLLLESSLAEEELSDAERVEAFRMIAVVHLAYGRKDEAKEAFVELLRIDADFKLAPSVSPEIRKTMRVARKQLAREQPMRPSGKMTQEVEESDDPKVILPAPMADQPPDAVAVTTSPYAEVKEETPFYATWWFWTIVGGVVVTTAAVTTTVVVTQPPSAPYGPFPLRSP